MKYQMIVTIADPNTPKGMMSDLIFKLTASFAHDPEQYGNGHYVAISGKEFYRQVVDLRYDKDFNRNDKKAWLKKWANTYWSGKDGSYYVKSLDIQEA